MQRFCNLGPDISVRNLGFFDGNETDDVDEGADNDFFIAALAIHATRADHGDGSIDENLVGVSDSIRLAVGEIQGERAEPFRRQRFAQVVSPHLHNCIRTRRTGKANPRMAFI